MRKKREDRIYRRVEQRFLDLSLDMKRYLDARGGREEEITRYISFVCTCTGVRIRRKGGRGRGRGVEAEEEDMEEEEEESASTSFLS